MEVFHLERFVEAQNAFNTYERALQELRNGKKRSHWIWFIFPQQKGLGKSYNSEYYGLNGLQEAKAYLAHPILGQRLRECCQELLNHEGESISFIMGSEIDVLKLKTSMTLFDMVSPNDIFATIIKVYYTQSL